MGEKFSTKVVGLALGTFFAAVYVLCVVWDLALPQYSMRSAWAVLLPGFTWLSFGSFLLGLVESFVYGLIAAAIGIPIYNYFAAREAMKAEARSAQEAHHG